jgi:hypothetical protein
MQHSNNPAILMAKYIKFMYRRAGREAGNGMGNDF